MSVVLMAPVCRPPQFLALALNSRAHALEGDFTPPPEPTLFIKGSNTLIGHGAAVIKPDDCQQFDYEAERGE